MQFFVSGLKSGGFLQNLVIVTQTKPLKQPSWRMLLTVFALFYHLSAILPLFDRKSFLSNFGATKMDLSEDLGKISAGFLLIGGL